MLNFKFNVKWKKIKLNFELGVNNSDSDSFDEVLWVNLIKNVVLCTSLLKVLQYFLTTLLLL